MAALELLGSAAVKTVEPVAVSSDLSDDVQRPCSSSVSEWSDESLSSIQEQPADGEPCELDKPEYKTDEFRLYQFKIKQCTNEEAHDWCLCPFAHPGEKAQRRDPRMFKYTGVSCPDYRKGTCKRGNACPYAHGVFEVWLHPSRYRTQTCKDAPHCTRQVCFFAHSLEEVRHVEPQDLPLLGEVDAAAAGTAESDGAASDAATAAAEAQPAPKCGSNTNSKATAAAAKAKAAAEAASAKDASSNASTSSGSSSMQDWSASLKLMSRQGSSCSTNASQVNGLEALGSLSSALCTPNLSLLSATSLAAAQQQQQQLLAGAAGSVMHHSASAASIAAAAAAVAAAAGNPNRLLQVPTDIALEAAALRAAAGMAPLCDTFGSLDLSAAAAAAAAAAVPSAAAVAAPPAVGLDPFGSGLAAGMGGWAGSANLHVPHLAGVPDAAQFGSGSPLNGASSSISLAAAAAAHQALAAQQQEMQEMLNSALLRQQQLANMQQQQHRDAMWAAAYSAAADVGLPPMTAAACADAAVQNTTAAAAAAAAAAASTGAQKQQQQMQMQLMLQQQQQQASSGMGILQAPMMLHNAAAAPAAAGQFAGKLAGLEQQLPLQLPAAPLVQHAGLAAALAHQDSFGSLKQQQIGLGALAGLGAPLQISVTAGAGALGAWQ